MLIPSLKRNTSAVVPWQWHACYMFACEYNRNAPLDVMPDNELSHPLIFTQCGGFWLCACVCVWGGGGGGGGGVGVWQRETLPPWTSMTHQICGWSCFL